MKVHLMRDQFGCGMQDATWALKLACGNMKDAEELLRYKGTMRAASATLRVREKIHTKAEEEARFLLKEYDALVTLLVKNMTCEPWQHGAKDGHTAYQTCPIVKRFEDQVKTLHKRATKHERKYRN